MLKEKLSSALAIICREYGKLQRLLFEDINDDILFQEVRKRMFQIICIFI
jgi:hypothetical protein